jgi:hypothetical protein
VLRRTRPRLTSIASPLASSSCLLDRRASSCGNQSGNRGRHERGIPRGAQPTGPPGPPRRARRLQVCIVAPEDPGSASPRQKTSPRMPAPTPAQGPNLARPAPGVFSSGVVDMNTGHLVVAGRCRRSDPSRLPPRRRIACSHGNGKRAAQPWLPPPSGGRPHGDLAATERLRPAVRGQVCTPHNVVGEIRPLRPEVKNA